MLMLNLVNKAPILNNIFSIQLIEMDQNFMVRAIYKFDFEIYKIVLYKI